MLSALLSRVLTCVRRGILDIVCCWGDVGLEVGIKVKGGRVSNCTYLAVGIYEWGAVSFYAAHRSLESCWM